MRKTTFKFIPLLTALCSVILFMRCADSEPPPEIKLDAASNFTLIDHGNQGNSLDLYVNFTPPATSEHISSVDLILVKAGQTAPDPELLEALGPDERFSFSPGSSEVAQRIDLAFNDFNGQPVETGQDYDAYLYTRPNGNAIGALSEKTTVRLEDEPYYEVSTYLKVPGIEAISFYPDGNYIMGPGASNSLYKIDLDNGTQSVFATGLAVPYGGGFNQKNGDFYISNFQNGEIWKFEKEGERVLAASGLKGPTGMVVDEDGNVFINNYYTSSISKLDTEGELSDFSHNNPHIKGPDGLVIADGELYCINFDNPKVMKVSANGEVSLFTTLPGAETGYIDYAHNQFYVASISQRRIYAIDKNGEHRVIAGSGLASTKDGPAALAGFMKPNGIAVVENVIYVSDEGTLRAITRHE